MSVIEADARGRMAEVPIADEFGNRQLSAAIADRPIARDVTVGVSAAKP
jgi:hypothetical protein